MMCCGSCKANGPCRDAYQFTVIQEAGKDLILWGPVSVESVSQDDKLIRMAAIEAALPHFWKRGALTMLHKDALIVGKVEELIKDVEPSDVSQAAAPLVESLQSEYGGLPTGVLTVTEAMVEAFPHLESVKGTRQFFAAARIYNDGEEASQAAIQEVRNGELDSFSLAGMPIEAEEVEHCEDGSCRTVIDVSKMTLSAITLGSRHGGEGPFSARTRNNGAALIAVTQAEDGTTTVAIDEDSVATEQSGTLMRSNSNDSRGETMTDDPEKQEQNPAKTVEEQDDEGGDEGVDLEAVASTVQELVRRVEGLEQRLGPEQADDDEEEEDEEEDEAEEAESPSEDSSKAIKEAVQEATAPLAKQIKELQAHKVFEQADTPPPASESDPKKERTLALEQAANSGDPYSVKEALRKMRGAA